jgi:uncharacterized protein with beta-barrel porin domain
MGRIHESLSAQPVLQTRISGGIGGPGAGVTATLGRGAAGCGGICILSNAGGKNSFERGIAGAGIVGSNRALGARGVSIATLILAAASLLTPENANAACAPAAGAGAPASGTTVTCSGVTTNQNAPNGYGDGSQNGLTINVQTGATVTSNLTSGAGISINSNNTINNSGTISTTGANGLILNNAQNLNNGIKSIGDLTLTNSGAVVGRSAAIVVGAGLTGNATINNSGTITGLPDPGSIPGFGGSTFLDRNAGNAIEVAGTLALSNSGTVTGLLSGESNLNITNSGTIQGSVGAQSNALVNGPRGATIVNSGLIADGGASTGFGVIGIGGIGSTYAITNSGTISNSASATGFGRTTIGNLTDNIGDGSGNAVNISNTASGVISSALGNTIVLRTQANFAGTVIFPGNTLTLDNAGTISSGNTGFAIFNVGGGAVTNLTNSGTIIGGVALSTENITIVTSIVPVPATSGTSSVFNSGTITGTGGTAIRFGGNANRLTLAPSSIINGNVVGSGTDIFQLGGSGTGTFNASLLGAGQQYSGFTTFNKLAGSNWSLTGNSTFAGATNVNGGILSVNGSLANSPVTVNAGGTLGGNGTVGNTTVNGGTLAPGNSIGLLTVQGNLVFTAASSYMVEVSPANADRTNVTGTATLGGATVNASFAAGTYVANQYTIVNATGGVIGTFNGPVNTNLPGGFKSSLSYDANNAVLNLALDLTPTPTPTPTSTPSGLNVNQTNVANALTGFFNRTGGIPMIFGALTPAGLTIASGEIATASQQATFDAMGMFVGLLTDPFIGGRGDPVTAGASAAQFADANDAASAYASNGKPRSNSERDAYAAIYRKAPVMADPYLPHWSVWAAGYGGSQTTDGNTTLGSNNTRSSIGGVAVGADYRFSPNTLAGFALAGGGTNFSVNGLGTGRSDLFQAGAFVRHTVGPAYLAAALAYGWQDITTDRTVTIAGTDLLRARFNANAFSGRVEGGYRFVTPWMAMGITPYAAGQFTTFELPSYAEQVVAGTNTFALTYGAKDVTASRSELGLRSDKSYAVQNGIFTLRGRAAWAHNFNTDRNIGATFQTLPGASFVVNGAVQASDSALVTGSAEMKWLNGFSLAGTFEGEFSNVTTSYAGKGVVRYAW